MIAARVQSVTFAKPGGDYRRISIDAARELAHEVGSLILWRPEYLDEEFQYAVVME